MANKVISLKKSSSFKKVASLGRRIKLSPWLTVQILKSDDSKNYVGVTASAKVGNAVTRNKLKRWVRACVQTEQWPESLQSKTVVFVFRAHVDGQFYSKIKYSEFLQLFKKL